MEDSIKVGLGRQKKTIWRRKISKERPERIKRKGKTRWSKNVRKEES